MTIMKTEQSLEGIYATHHRDRRGESFIIQGDVRGTFLKETIGTGKNVLDIGCRDGALTGYYAEGNEVLGLDIDSDALARAEATHHIKTKHTDLHGDWGVSAGSFDVVVAAEVIEHLYYPDVVLGKIHTALRGGGIIVGSIPNAFSLANRFRFFMGTKKGTPLSDPTHINQFSRPEFESLLKKYFDEVEIIPLGRFSFLDKFFPGLFSFMLLFKAKKK